MPTPKQGSRKAEVYDVFKSKGEKAAYKVGKKLELTDGTIRSWIGIWTKPEPVYPETGKDHEYNPRWSYESEAEARAAADAQARGIGLEPDAFVTVPNADRSRWAFIPRHRAPQFAETGG